METLIGGKKVDKGYANESEIHSTIFTRRKSQSMDQYTHRGTKCMDYTVRSSLRRTHQVDSQFCSDLMVSRPDIAGNMESGYLCSRQKVMM